MAEPWIGFFMYLFTDRCMQSWNAASLFLLAIRCGGKKDFGLGSKFNCATRAGSDHLRYGVQTSPIISYLLPAYLRSRSTFCIFNLPNQPMSLSSLINSPEIGLCKLLHVKLLICERGEVHISDCGKHFAWENRGVTRTDINTMHTSVFCCLVAFTETKIPLYRWAWGTFWHAGSSPASFHWTACSPWVQRWLCPPARVGSLPPLSQESPEHALTACYWSQEAVDTIISITTTI